MRISSHAARDDEITHYLLRTGTSREFWSISLVRSYVRRKREGNKQAKNVRRARGLTD